MISDPQLFAKVSERCLVKLASVVRDEHPKNSEVAYYVLLDKFYDILLSDSHRGLYFHPFCKVINPYH